ncbi:hypothetical protein CNMCM5623_005119 [Aspergillus felis]|uniref:Aquaporin-like protein n=1 Tax=Aspergillus felis TaxID=1287682 RepID=A0A8H6QJE9_9EURO|nr:hypothetical protein CNMCM5623_005119 [Aspergillus felis]
MTAPDQYRDDFDINTNIRSLSSKPQIQPFAGRIGGNQGLVLDRHDPGNLEVLKKTPDAAPLMTFRDAYNFHGFIDLNLWRFALIECVGTMMLSFITAWMGSSPLPPSSTPPDTAGVFGTPEFLGPLFGGISNWLFLTLFIFSFSSISGSRLNPTITVATFFARLISFPRAVLYLSGQILGGALAGWILQPAWGSEAFLVGGCYINTELVPVRQALLLEFICCLILIFLAFGVGLDPRQVQVYGAALSPWLVGLALGLVSWGSAYTRKGYNGASMLVFSLDIRLLIEGIQA